MRCTWESLPGVKRVGLLAVRGVLVSSAVLFCLPCLADLPPLPVVPQPIAWVSGPATASLGSEAELKVPANYSFTEASGARAFLEGMRAPVPKGLVGILQPNSGGWWVTFEYSEVGFVKENEKDQLDPDALLKSFSPGRSARQVTWEIKPVYDTTQHSLEWAVRTEGGSEKAPVIKHTVRLLGRRGVLDAAVTRSAATGAMKERGASGSSLDASRDSSGLSELKELVKGVSFKEDQSYSDYKQGDKVAAFGLSGLISGSFTTASGDAAGGTEASGGIRAFWIGLAAIIIVGAGAGMLLAKKISRQRSRAPVAQASRASAPVVVEKPLAAAAPVPAVNGSKSRHTEKGRPAVKNNGHPARSRKKVFNYQKFYTEMVLQGPAPVIGVETSGYELDLNRLALQVEAPKADPATVLNVNSELIAHQKAIIEEQKRLIQEQGKLIDEKTRLISEKNQLLQRQSDLIDNNLV